MSDYYVGSDRTTEYQLADNLNIDDNRDLVTRGGCEIYDEDAPQLLSGEKNINAVIEVDDVVYQHSARSLYTISAGTMSELLGPSSNKVFGSGDESLKGSFAEWNKHLICASEEYSPIQRAYKNNSGTLKLNNLGLPSLSLFGAITLANELKSDFNAHIADATEHTSGVDAVNTVSSSNATDLLSLLTLVNELVVDYTAHHADARLVTPAFHAATESVDKRLLSLPTATTLDSAIALLTELRSKYNLHDADTTAHGTDTLHQVTSNYLPSGAGTAGAKNYVYILYYAHSYYVNDVLFKEVGPTVEISVGSVNEPSTNAITISNIPALLNGTANNWETGEIKVEIGRTSDGGDTFFFVGEVLASAGSFTDRTSDASLQLNVPIYIEGGVLDNEPPPEAKYLSVVNDALILGNVKEGSVLRPSRVRISKRFQLYACPGEFYVDFDDEITGVSLVNIYPIIFTQNKTYRLEGLFDATGAGGYQKREISSRVGCVANRSIVQVMEGIVFAGVDGFYFTDGFKVNKISKDINETYAAFENKEDICGAYDKKKNWVLWGVSESSALENNDVVYVGHGNYPKANGDIPFTTWSGGNMASNFSATCLAYINESIVRGDHRGYLFRHDDSLLDDPKVDTLSSPGDWYTSAIYYDFRSLGYDFGSADRRKWVPKIVVNANNEASLSLLIESNNDNSGVFRELKPILDRNNAEWGDPTATWSDSTRRWNYFPMISAWRRFPAVGLRCQYKQVRFSNNYTLIDDSTSVGGVSIDATTKVITLLSHPTFTWVQDPVDYYISFSSDDYAMEYLITEISGADITVSDAANNLTDQSDVEWKIYGYKKREVLSLANFVIHHDYLTSTQQAYRTT